MVSGTSIWSAERDLDRHLGLQGERQPRLDGRRWRRPAGRRACGRPPHLEGRHRVAQVEGHGRPCRRRQRPGPAASRSVSAKSLRTRLRADRLGSCERIRGRPAAAAAVLGAGQRRRGRRTASATHAAGRPPGRRKPAAPSVRRRRRLSLALGCAAHGPLLRAAADSASSPSARRGSATLRRPHRFFIRPRLAALGDILGLAIVLAVIIGRPLAAAMTRRHSTRPPGIAPGGPAASVALLVACTASGAVLPPWRSGPAHVLASPQPDRAGARVSLGILAHAMPAFGTDRSASGQSATKIRSTPGRRPLRTANGRGGVIGRGRAHRPAPA